MNRAIHIKQTLPRNIEDNAGYHNIEFVVLDYNSQDDLYSWSKNSLRPYVRSGLLKYYRTREPSFFLRSHSRNMMFRLATGDILCNIDADNFTGEGFADYINGVFRKDRNVFLGPGIYKGSPDVQGRICVRKDDFYKINGFDEIFLNYGFEDHDLIQRLKQLGRKKVVIREHCFLRAISHGNQIRIGNEGGSAAIFDIFVSYIDFTTSELICLLHNGVFERFYLLHRAAKYMHYYLGLQKSFKDNIDVHFRPPDSGRYTSENGNITLLGGRGKVFGILKPDPAATGFLFTTTEHTRTFFRITDNNIKADVLLIKNMAQNKRIALINKRNRSTINGNGFGKGKVYINFSNESIILR